MAVVGVQGKLVLDTEILICESALMTFSAHQLLVPPFLVFPDRTDCDLHSVLL